MMANRIMTWEEMVNSYPGKWVVVINPNKDGPEIISGEVIDVKTDEEIEKYRIEHRTDGCIFRRTTEEKWSGVIDADFIIETV